MAQKKRNIVIRVLILLPVIVLVSTCKKYPEDNRRYFRTPCERIAKLWQLTKITDSDGRDYADSVISFKRSGNNWAIVPQQSYTYRGMIINLGRSKNKFCLETGIFGDFTVLNKPFSSGSYEIKDKRTLLSLDVRVVEDSPTRYFIGEYIIFKMTSSELIFGINEVSQVFFRAVD